MAPRRKDRTSGAAWTARETSEFLLRVCHDLRSSLRAIRAHSELIRANSEASHSSDLDGRLGFIVDGARRIDHVVDCLSDYSLALQIDRAAFQPVQMGVVLRSALAKLEKELHARELQ